MKVSITATDSGTGETSKFHATVAKFTDEAIRDAYQAHITEDTPQPAHAIIAWRYVDLINFDKAGFIFSCEDPYFGPLVVAGIAYIIEA